MRHPLAAFSLVLVCTGLAPCGARADGNLPDDFVDVSIATGLDNPVSMAFVPDGELHAGRRLLFVEQNTARVRLLVDGAIAAVDPVATIAGVRADYIERGLLGIAVDPRWPSAPYLYFHFTSLDGYVHVARYRASGDVGWSGNGAFALDPASRYEVIADVPDANSVHNGGTLRFGPDSLLYASFGDDYDWCAAQDTTSLVGKILRLDVRQLPDGPGGPAPRALIAPADNPFIARPEPNSWLVGVLGLRNPFRFQVDRGNGTLVIGDVGEDAWEELDRVRPGMNCGWPLYEGFSHGINCDPSGSPLTFPIYAYGHFEGAAVMALGVCRRAGGGPYTFPPEYEGNIFVADYFSGWIRRLRRESGNWVLAQAVGQPSSLNWAIEMRFVPDGTFGPDGALWYIRQGYFGQAGTGEIHAVRYLAPTGVGGERTAAGLALGPARPNPGRPPIAFDYTLSVESDVRLVVHDLVGRELRTLESGRRGAGRYEAVWDGLTAAGRQAAPGLYWISLRSGTRQASRRVVLAR